MILNDVLVVVNPNPNNPKISKKARCQRMPQYSPVTPGRLPIVTTTYMSM